jgi:hypothetical protein
MAEPHSLFKSLFTEVNIRDAVTMTNFIKALGEDWFCGSLLKSECVGQHLQG